MIDEKDRIFADNLYKYIKDCKIKGIDCLNVYPDMKDINETYGFKDPKHPGFRFELNMRVIREE